MILGPLAETNLVQALQLSPDISLFFTRPISLGLLLCALVSLVWPFWQAYRKRRREAVAGPSI